MGILTPKKQRKYNQHITIQCDDCGRIYSVKYRPKRHESKEIFYCDFCRFKGERSPNYNREVSQETRDKLKKSNIGKKKKKKEHFPPNPLIITPYSQRITGKKVVVQCEQCNEQREIKYSGIIMERRNSFLCDICRLKPSWKTNPAILTPPEERISQKKILYRCEECNGIKEMIYQGKITEQKSPLLCPTCLISWKSNPAILTPPLERKTHKKIRYHCEHCGEIKEVIYTGQEMEQRTPLLCQSCTKFYNTTNRIPIIERNNPAILIPPAKRFAGEKIQYRCEHCREIKEVKYTGRDMEQRIPFLCHVCATKFHAHKRQFPIEEKINIAILTPPSKRFIGEKIQYRCEHCGEIKEIKYTGMRMEQRQPLLCLSCAVKVACKNRKEKEIDLSLRTNPAILAPPEKRKRGTIVKIQCQRCYKISETIYHTNLEKRVPYLCQQCAILNKDKERINPSILTPPHKRISGQKITYKCEICKKEYQIIYKLEFEEREPFICNSCAHIDSTLRTNPAILTPPEQRRKGQNVRVRCNNCGEVRMIPYRNNMEKQAIFLCSSCASSKMWQNAEYVQKVFDGFKYKGVGISSKPQEWLFELVRQYYPDAVINKWIAGKIPDITINSEMVIVEYDCFFWHQDKRGKDLQAVRLFLLNGYRVLRFFVYGQEQYDADFYLREIKKFIRSKKQVAIIEVNKSEEDIEEIDTEQITLFE